MIKILKSSEYEKLLQEKKWIELQRDATQDTLVNVRDHLQRLQRHMDVIDRTAMIICFVIWVIVMFRIIREMRGK